MSKSSNVAESCVCVGSSITVKDPQAALTALKKDPRFFVRTRAAKSLGNALYQFGFLFHSEKDNPNKFKVEVKEGTIPDLSCFQILKKHVESGGFLVFDVDGQDLLLEFRDGKVNAKDVDIDFELDG